MHCPESLSYQVHHLRMLILSYIDRYVDLEVLDVSSLVSDPSQLSSSEFICASGIVDRAFAGFKATGFVVLQGHGLDANTIARHFAIGQMFFNQVTEDEKRQHHARIAEEGSWAGYKVQGYFKRPGGSSDSTEWHDFYPDTVVEAQQPKKSWPYLDEITAFYVYNHFTLLRIVMAILSEGLSLPPDSLWNLHHRQHNSTSQIAHIETKDLFRAGLYHPPPEESREKNKYLWLQQHTDRGSATFIYSQPISGLQVLVDGSWKYVRHYPNGIIVNLGDMMELVTGRLLKAAPHRVSEPADDQRHLRRLGLFYFGTMLPNTPLQPLEALAGRTEPVPPDFFDEFDGRVPTAEEWQVQRGKTTGRAGKFSAEKTADVVLFAKRFAEKDGTA